MRIPMFQRMILMLAVLATLPAAAADKDNDTLPFEAKCTTSAKIQYAEVITVPAGLEYSDVYGAIQEALGSNYNTNSGSYVSREIVGEWFYEYDADQVIYAGLTVRSHYLQLAIYADTESVTTIVCDSNNLRQKSSSIHRKVPNWKSRLDSTIRVELGQAMSGNRAEAENQAIIKDANESKAVNRPAKSSSDIVAELFKLAELQQAGLITIEEYNNLKAALLEDAF